MTLLGYFCTRCSSIFAAAAAAAKSLQSCPTLCDPIDGSPLGSSVPGILQARTLEWVAISLSNAWKWKVKGKSLSSVRLFATLWTAAYQAPPSMGFSRREYWSGVPLPWLPHKSFFLLHLVLKEAGLSILVISYILCQNVTRSHWYSLIFSMGKWKSCLLRILSTILDLEMFPKYFLVIFLSHVIWAKNSTYHYFFPH